MHLLQTLPHQRMTTFRTLPIYSDRLSNETEVLETMEVNTSRSGTRDA
jgi:hypothetical protein